MNNKKNLIISLIGILLLIICMILLINGRPKEVIIQDENMLYYKQFNHVILKFERYEYVLGQNMLVGVEKSTDNGKKFHAVSDDVIQVSNEAQFVFLNENLGFAISTGNVEIANNAGSLYVTTDGGKTFTSSTFEYENERLEYMSIDSLPYLENNILKLKCSVYDFKKNGDGYENVELSFESTDNGLTWKLKK